MMTLHQPENQYLRGDARIVCRWGSGYSLTKPCSTLYSQALFSSFSRCACPPLCPVERERRRRRPRRNGWNWTDGQRNREDREREGEGGAHRETERGSLHFANVNITVGGPNGFNTETTAWHISLNCQQYRDRLKSMHQVAWMRRQAGQKW